LAIRLGTLVRDVPPPTELLVLLCMAMAGTLVWAFDEELTTQMSQIDEDVLQPTTQLLTPR
jgi:hypothetical protein